MLSQQSVSIKREGQDKFYDAILIGNLELMNQYLLMHPDRLNEMPALWRDYYELPANEYGYVDPAADNNLALKYAARNGHLEIIKELLRLKYRGIYPAIDLFNDQHLLNPDELTSLSCAAKCGRKKVVEYILSFPDCHPWARDNEAFIEACGGGHQYIVKLLYKVSKITRASLTEAMQTACANNQASVLKLLLEYKRALSFDNCDDASFNGEFIYACTKGHVKIAHLLYPGILRSLPNDEDGIEVYHNAFLPACETGYFKIIRMLLPKIIKIAEVTNHNTILNSGFTKVCRLGNLKIIQLFLVPAVKEKMNPILYVDGAWTAACKHQHSDVINMLLKYFPPDVSAVNAMKFEITPAGNKIMTDMFSLLCFYGHADTAKNLLDKFEPEQNRIHLIFEQACESGHIEIIKLLYEKFNNQLAVNNIENGLVSACKEGHDEIVKLILSDDRVNPAVYNNQPLTEAASHGRFAVVKLLLPELPLTDDEYKQRINKVKLNDKPEKANERIKNVSTHGYVGILQWLASRQGLAHYSEGYQDAFSNAWRINNYEMVEWLLSYTKIWLGEQELLAGFLQSCHLGSANLVRLYLKHLDLSHEKIYQGILFIAKRIESTVVDYNAHKINVGFDEHLAILALLMEKLDFNKLQAPADIKEINDDWKTFNKGLDLYRNFQTYKLCFFVSSPEKNREFLPDMPGDIHHEIRNQFGRII